MYLNTYFKYMSFKYYPPLALNMDFYCFEISLSTLKFVYSL